MAVKDANDLNEVKRDMLQNQFLLELRRQSEKKPVLMQSSMWKAELKHSNAHATLQR